jgi:hypothetical protein
VLKATLDRLALQAPPDRKVQLVRLVILDQLVHKV